MLSGSKKKAASNEQKHVGGDYSLRKQLQDVRVNRNSQWRTTRLGKQRVFTVNDLEQQQKLAQDTQADWGGKRNNGLYIV